MKSLLTSVVLPIATVAAVALAPTSVFAGTSSKSCYTSGSTCKTDDLRFDNGEKIKYVLNAKNLNTSGNSDIKIKMVISSPISGKTALKKTFNVSDDTYHTGSVSAPTGSNWKITFWVQASQQDDVSGSYTGKIKR